MRYLCTNWQRAFVGWVNEVSCDFISNAIWLHISQTRHNEDIHSFYAKVVHFFFVHNDGIILTKSTAIVFLIGVILVYQHSNTFTNRTVKEFGEVRLLDAMFLLDTTQSWITVGNYIFEGKRQMHADYYT